MEVNINIWNNGYIVSYFLVFKRKDFNSNVIVVRMHSLSHCFLQHFLQRLSNYTGYSTSKLVGKKLWRVYDTLTCQVNTQAALSPS